MKLDYKLDDKLPIGKLLLYGFQWLAICIPIVITTTFIAPPGMAVLYTQKLFAIMGVTMLLQIFFGHGLPLVSGPAAALLMCVIAVSAQGCPYNEIYPSIIVGAVIVSLIAASGLLKHAVKLFTPRIIVSILLLISFVTLKPAISLMYGGDDSNFVTVLSIVSITLMALINSKAHGVWKNTVVLWSLIICTIIYYLAKGAPTNIPTDTSESFLLIKGMHLDVGLVLSFVLCSLAILVNDVGSIQSLGECIGAGNMKRRLTRGVFLTGIMDCVSSLTGVLGPVNFSLSPGVVASMSCSSKYPLVLAAGIMIILSFSPDAVAWMLLIPDPVMGIMLLYLMGTQVAAGLNMLQTTSAAPSFQDGMVMA
ncbi:MAG: purine/pyrimidine permease, partial [Alistipes sp.]|nr:purine/pyrimidine permease [Candidatus Alistipes equi]